MFKWKTDYTPWIKKLGGFDEFPDCQCPKCRILELGIPRTNGLTNKEHQQKMDKLRKDPDHILFEGVREIVKCKWEGE